MLRCAAHTRLSVNIWVGIKGDHLIGPYLLRTSMQQIMWFAHDGVLVHYSRNVRNYLDVTFDQQWIGRGGPVRWPFRSLLISSLIPFTSSLFFIGLITHFTPRENVC